MRRLEANGAFTVDDILGINIPGLSDEDSQTLRQLLAIWKERLPKNLKRSLYYDAEQAFKDLGIALPPNMRNLKYVLGWPTKAVKEPAQRSVFEGFRRPGVDDPFELGETLVRNQFDLELGQGIISAYKHGCAFASVTKGLEGEPDVMIRFHAADVSAAIWDRRARRVKAAVTIGALHQEMPLDIVLFLPDKVVRATRTKTSKWQSVVIPNTLGVCPVVPITYDPQLGQPFGRSRITNAVMNLGDMGVRTSARMEGNAEFYSAPKIALLGVDEDAFDSSHSAKWSMAIDRILAMSRDEDGNIPSLTQLTQASMQPHSEMLRTLASAFAAETNLPLSSLGVLHDNPSSAEAINASERDLVRLVRHQNRFVLGPELVELAGLAVMVRDGLQAPPADIYRLQAKWANPEFQSVSVLADAAMKIASAWPMLALEDDVLGMVFDDEAMERIRSSLTAQEANSVLSQLLNPPAPEVGGSLEEEPDDLTI